MAELQTKRIYEKVCASDGVRILVDRLWPRGIKKEVAKISFWAKSVAPSNELRKWYQHDLEKWGEFCKRYFVELDDNPDSVAELREAMAKGSGDDAERVITFVYSSKEIQFNNASALIEYLEDQK